LSGVRVLDVTTAIAGPLAALVLSALGADVIKVERPIGGDDTRAWGPPFWQGESATFLAMNAGKRSLAVDLDQPLGGEIIRRLVERADVFLQSLRPGVAERLGLGVEAVRNVNPSIVYCSIGSYGRTGPLADRPGYDPLMQASAGLMSLTGEPDGPPTRPGFSYVDQGTGMWGVIGILAALRQRAESGHGAVVDASLYETALGWVAYPIAGYLASGVVPTRLGSGISILAPSRLFETADGWAMITAANDRFFARLCDALGVPQLAADPRFATNPQRVANREAVDELIAERTRHLETAELVALLERAGVPVAPVRDIAEVVAHPQTEAIGIIEGLPHDRIEDLRLLGLPLNLDGRRLPLAGAPPTLGEHTRAILEDLGYPDAVIEALASRGVVKLAEVVST
jgi:crotonobetainyl-CoA:carnitine CoA-transferase CaiB-like acyl-CoA transferase